MKFLSDKYIFLFLALAVLILWQLLLPGYVLTLDTIAAPTTTVNISDSVFNNTLPIQYLINFVNILLPAWLIQKVYLFILFFNLGYLSYKFLPLPKNTTVRLFSALVYVANPFVYSRFLAGHWSHLMAYALLPVFIHLLFKFTKSPAFKTGLKLFSLVFLISLFSLHFFVMAVLVMVVWFLYHFVKYLVNKKSDLLKLTFKNLFLCGLLFAVLSAYWLIPVINNGQLFVNRFDIRHWLTFAASGYNGISTTLNVLSLNGFWGEGHLWAKQFAWPQDYLFFWIAICSIWSLVLIGLVSGFKNIKTRSISVFFLILGIISFIFSTGAGDTIFKSFNIWMYENIPLWNGFRDSQKFSGLLALSYVVMSGYGVNAIINFFNNKKKELVKNFSSFIFLIPIMLGFLMWGGFKSQIKPVWYPYVWDEAKSVIQSDNSDYKVLFLPWHGYLSLNFNNNILVANPAKRYFGDKAIVSRSTEIDDIYDQEINTDYKNLDKVVRGNASLSPNQTVDFFVNQKIKYIVFFQDLIGVDNLKYDFLSSTSLKEKITDNQLIMLQLF